MPNLMCFLLEMACPTDHLPLNLQVIVTTRPHRSHTLSHMCHTSSWTFATPSPKRRLLGDPCCAAYFQEKISARCLRALTEVISAFQHQVLF